MRDLRCTHCKAPTTEITAHFRADEKRWSLPVQVCTSTSCLLSVGGHFVTDPTYCEGVKDALAMSTAPKWVRG